MGSRVESSHQRVVWSRFWSRTSVVLCGLVTLMTCATPSEVHSCSLP